MPCPESELWCAGLGLELSSGRLQCERGSHGSGCPRQATGREEVGPSLRNLCPVKVRLCVLLNAAKPWLRTCGVPSTEEEGGRQRQEPRFWP